MKTARLISFVMMLTMSGFVCIGQVKVTGHASAEVVESVSASCSSNTDITLNMQENKDFDLGSFMIKGTASSTCAVVIGNAKLNNSKSIQIESNCPGGGMALIADEKGNCSLNLIARNEGLLAGGQYQGNYGVTFAYN